MADEYIDLGINTTSECNIDFDDNDIVEEYKKPSFKTHLEDGDKLVWYKDPTIVATWHSNGRIDIFDKQNVSICDANFRIQKGHWRDKTEHGIGTEPNHWLYDDKPIQEYLKLFPEFWKANEIKKEQSKKERKPRQKKETSEKTANVITDIQEDTIKEYKYKSEKYLYDSNYSDTYPDTLRKQATPSWVVEDMVDLLPDEVWRTDSKFLDIYCKSGIFLEIIIDRLMKKVDYSSIGLTSDREIKQYIIENQVYAICWNKWYLDLSRKAINGKSSMVGNIYCRGPEIENMTEDEAKAVLEDARAQNSIDKTILELDIRKEFFGSMKIDAVVGNPPYNNDIYIPFVELGHKLAKQCSCFITPAKWQAKGDNASDKPNERFRQNIVPYMSKIAFYTDTCDVFDIAEWGGISYYILGKDKSNVNVRTISPRNSNIDSEYQEHDENTIILYNRNILTIIGKVGQLGEGFKQSLYVKNIDHGENSIASQLGFKRQVFVGEQDRGQQEIPPDYVEVMQGEKVCGYKKKSELFTQLNIDKWKCITSIIVSGQSRYKENGTTQRYINIYAIKPNQIPKGSFPVLKYFDTENEAKSFISYFNTSLIKFLFNLGICGTTLTKEFFRFIPDPMKYDHIFTDEELYKKYDLTEKEINIIESVIKGHK